MDLLLRFQPLRSICSMFNLTQSLSSLDPWDALDRILSHRITNQLATSTWIPHDLVNDLCRVQVHHPAAPFAHKSVRALDSPSHVPC